MTANGTDLAVGVDFGGTKILGALVDRTGGIVAEHRLPTPHEGDKLLDAMADMVHHLEEQTGSTVAGLGVGAAGLVDREGNLHFGPNVGGITNVDIVSEMQGRLPGRRIRVDNDANAATWGECLFGAGKRRREMIMVTLGTGIGGGAVTSGRLFRGHYGFAAEFGHMTVEPKGASCTCGKAGCWEAYASGRALGRLGRDAAREGGCGRLIELAGGDMEAIRGEHVTEAAREGDLGGLKVVDEYAYWLALGLAGLVAMFDPEVVIIGGGLAEESDLYLDTSAKHLEGMIFGAHARPKVPVLVAELGERAGAVGAAMLVHGEEMPEV